MEAQPVVGVGDDSVMTLPRISSRGAFHAAAAQALETIYADRLEEAYDRLAYHYSALAHVERLPAEQRDRHLLRLVLRQASLLIYLGRFQEALGLLLRRHTSFERLQDASLAGHYHFLLARTYFFLGDGERTVQSAQRSILPQEVAATVSGSVLAGALSGFAEVWEVERALEDVAAALERCSRDGAGRRRLRGQPERRRVRYRRDGPAA